jgi:transcriptional regulator, araC family (fragment)
MNHFIVDGNYKDLLLGYGIDLREFLRKLSLPEDLFNQKPIHLKEEEYYRFVQMMGEYIGGEPAMIKLASSEQIETFSPPLFAAWCSKNGEKCIERLSEYKKLIGPMSWVLKKEGDSLTVSIKAGSPEPDIPSLLIQSEFAFLIGLLRRATKEEIRPLCISVKKKPLGQDLADYSQTEVKTGEEDEIVFLKKDLEKPFLSFNPAMWDYFESEMNKRLTDLQVDDSISARVRSVLSELLPGGASGIEDVAEKLGLSKRTLQRKLSEENTNFQKQLNSAREALAVHYIRNTEMSIADIAYLLGYAEQNSFLRAFTIWTGKSVTEYKQRLNK